MLRNLALNTNKSKPFPQPKSTQSIFLPLDIFSHLLGAILATNLALPGGDPIDLEIRRICGLIIIAERL